MFICVILCVMAVSCRAAPYRVAQCESFPLVQERLLDSDGAEAKSWVRPRERVNNGVM